MQAAFNAPQEPSEFSNGATVLRRAGAACSLGIVIHPSDVHEGGRLVAFFRTRASDDAAWELNGEGLELEDVKRDELEEESLGAGGSEFLEHYDGGVPWLEPTKRGKNAHTISAKPNKGAYFNADSDGPSCLKQQKIAYLLGRTVWLCRMRNSKGRAPSQMSNDFLEWLDKHSTWFWEHGLLKPLCTRAFDRLLNQITVATKRTKSRAGAIMAAITDEGALRAKKSRSRSASESVGAAPKKAKSSARGDENMPPVGADAKVPISLLSPPSASSSSSSAAMDFGASPASAPWSSWELDHHHSQMQHTAEADAALARVLLDLRRGGGDSLIGLTGVSL